MSLLYVYLILIQAPLYKSWWEKEPKAPTYVLNLEYDTLILGKTVLCQLQIATNCSIFRQWQEHFISHFNIQFIQLCIKVNF